ncbi:hypothetical protein Q1695_010543 [Nippostrongylus brasiliensis]|nr:hypothetical protein Q1695_010543 [Nippostrongylus brasiliensis]
MVHLLSLLNRGSEVTPQAISSEFVTLPLSDPRYAVFLRLYRMELIEMLSDPVNIECLPTFAKFFESDDDIPAIKKEVLSPSSEEGKMNALHYFLDIVFEDAEAVKLLDKQILKVNPLLWNEVHLCGVSADSRTLKFFLEKFFPEGDEKLILLDRCAAALDVEFFRTALDKLNNRYPELLNIEPPKTSVDELDERYWAAKVLRTLPHLNRPNDDWFYDFVEALSRDPYNRAVLWYLLPNYEEVLENRIIERRCRRSSANRKQEELIEEELIVTEMRKPSDYAKFRTSLYDDLEEPEGLHLRAYQEELVEPALRGKNTIACAPTGSGKTEVAIYVAVSHLNEKESKKEPARVAMLVPRTPLVDQQKYRFHKYVRGRYYVEGFHGSGLKGSSRRDSVLACDIVVMTPQILLNMLKSIRQDERLYVCDFSLLIFDEVHHCDKDHPYNILMQTVHSYQGPKPQTMGLTASLVAGKLMTEESGMEAIHELMANMGATALASVKRHADILAQYVPKPDDFTIKVDRPELKEPSFLKCLIKIMESIQNEVQPQLKRLTEKNETEHVLPKEDVKFEDPLATEKYIQKINTLATTLSRIRNGDFKFEPSIALEYLSVLSQGISINDLMPAKYSLMYLERNLAALKEKFQLKCSRIFFKHFEDGLPILKKCAAAEASDAKPIVMALEKELRTQFKQDSNSRAIIFVTRRSTAVELMHYLNTDQVLGCKDLVGFVTSTSKKSQEYGQTQEEQTKVLDEFNRGIKKVIVATSVVEEGLDVSTCNLIIKYNSSSNAVQRVQRRGRARARDSRSVLIVLSENVAQTEYQAIMAEKIADKCLKRIEDRGEKALEKKVLEVMDRQAKERKVHEEHRKRAQEALKDKLFSIRCKIDSTDVCTSSDVRTINGSSYVCVDPTIWGRMEIRTKDVSSKMKFVDEVTQILAEVHCKCGQTIGNVMKYAGTYLPMLNISNLMFSEKIEGQDAPAEAITQWSKAGGRFWIPEATEHELRQMLLKLNTENKEDKTKLDAMCEKIVAQQEKMLERERRKKEETRRTKTEWNAD